MRGWAPAVLRGVRAIQRGAIQRGSKEGGSKGQGEVACGPLRFLTVGWLAPPLPAPQKRSLTLRDDSNRSIECTLWGKYVSDPGDQIFNVRAGGGGGLRAGCGRAAGGGGQ